jgi:hypothetical protein
MLKMLFRIFHRFFPFLISIFNNTPKSDLSVEENSKSSSTDAEVINQNISNAAESPTSLSLEVSPASEIMLPTLSEFGIDSPAFIRKIDSCGHWNPEGCCNLAERAKAVVEKIFKKSEGIYSLWLVREDKEFYGVVASLSANRSPKNQDIHFIWMTATELEEVGIKSEKVVEGDCLHVQELHFNVRIDKASAEKLCLNLFGKGRKAKTCKKKRHTILILDYQKQIGCKATETDRVTCECEHR